MLAAIVKYKILHSLANVELLGHKKLQYRVRIIKATLTDFSTYYCLIQIEKKIFFPA